MSNNISSKKFTTTCVSVPSEEFFDNNDVHTNRLELFGNNGIFTHAVAEVSEDPAWDKEIVALVRTEYAAKRIAELLNKA